MGEGAVPQSAFALEGRNIWHAATLSVAQQLIGPLRVRADMRLSLHVPGGYSPVLPHPVRFPTRKQVKQPRS